MTDERAERLRHQEEQWERRFASGTALAHRRPNLRACPFVAESRSMSSGAATCSSSSIVIIPRREHRSQQAASNVMSHPRRQPSGKSLRRRGSVFRQSPLFLEHTSIRTGLAGGRERTSSRSVRHLMRLTRGNTESPAKATTTTWSFSAGSILPRRYGRYRRSIAPAAISVQPSDRRGRRVTVPDTRANVVLRTRRKVDLRRRCTTIRSSLSRGLTVDRWLRRT